MTKFFLFLQLVFLTGKCTTACIWDSELSVAGSFCKSPKQTSAWAKAGSQLRFPPGVAGTQYWSHHHCVPLGCVRKKNQQPEAQIKPIGQRHLNQCLQWLAKTLPLSLITKTIFWTHLLSTNYMPDTPWKQCIGNNVLWAWRSYEAERQANHLQSNQH